MFSLLLTNQLWNVRLKGTSKCWGSEEGDLLSSPLYIESINIHKIRFLSRKHQMTVRDLQGPMWSSFYFSWASAWSAYFLELTPSQAVWACCLLSCPCYSLCPVRCHSAFGPQLHTPSLGKLFLPAGAQYFLPCSPRWPMWPCVVMVTGLAPLSWWVCGQACFVHLFIPTTWHRAWPPQTLVQ